jgi:hypothetical protein
MRIFLALLFLCFPISLVGCGESKPDPQDREDFVDTTDASAVGMPAPADGGSGDAAPSE